MIFCEPLQQRALAFHNCLVLHFPSLQFDADNSSLAPLGVHAVPQLFCLASLQALVKALCVPYTIQRATRYRYSQWM